ncbi:MAG TPA: hypothetical protein PLE61_15285, partial [Vicinamibacterales bacterium]|nr:hypothetical protein [Vicinamibacterales bacterium]
MSEMLPTPWADTGRRPGYANSMAGRVKFQDANWRFTIGPYRVNVWQTGVPFEEVVEETDEYIIVRAGGVTYWAISMNGPGKVWPDDPVGDPDWAGDWQDYWRIKSLAAGGPLVWANVTEYGVTVENYIVVRTSKITGQAEVIETHVEEAWSPWYTVAWSGKGFRLGEKFTLELPTDESGQQTREPPLYGVLDGKCWYEFFADADTTLAASCGPYSWSGPYGTMPVDEHAGEAPEHPVSAGVILGNVLFTWVGTVEFASLVMCGEAVSLDGIDYSPGYGEEWCAPSVTIIATGRITRFGKAQSGWARVDTPHGTAEVYPDAGGTWKGYLKSWPRPGDISAYAYLGLDLETGTSAALNAAWAAGQRPYLPAFDLQIPIRGGLPRLALGTSAFRAATLRITQALSVHRPDGRTPSQWRWETAGLDSSLIREDPTETVIAVPAGGGTVKRLLWARWPHWADWFAFWKENDLGEEDTRGPEQMEWVYSRPDGTSRKVTMAFNEYYRAKHLASADPFVQEDLWNWSLYSDLEVEIAYTPPPGQPVAARADLTLEVEHSYLQVGDEHRIYPSYGSNMDVSVVAGQTARYTLRFTEGDTATVDLLFPDSGGPVLLGYVTGMRLSGLQEGTYTIRRINLRHRRPAYVKLAFGPPKAEPSAERAEQIEALKETDPILYYRLLREATPQWPTFTVATKGSFPIGVLPDLKFKEDESGSHGGSPRYVEPLYGRTVKLHYQKGLHSFLAELNAVEGLEVAADYSAYEAACRDEFGVLFGPAMADWLHPLVPWQSLLPGKSIDLYASATCRAIRPTNLVEYGFRFDHAVHSGLETLIASGGQRVDPDAAPVRVWAVYSPDEPPEGAELSIAGPETVELAQGGLHRFEAETVPGVGSLLWEVYPADAGSIESGGIFHAAWKDCWAVIT